MVRRQLIVLLAAIPLVVSCPSRTRDDSLATKESLQSLLERHLPDWNVEVNDYCQVRLGQKFGDFSRYRLDICDSCLDFGRSNDTVHFAEKPNCRITFGPINRTFYPPYGEGQHSGMGNSITVMESHFSVAFIDKHHADSLVGLLRDLIGD